MEGPCAKIALKPEFAAKEMSVSLLHSAVELATVHLNRADLAQLVERVAFNHVVVGSIPTDGEPIIFIFLPPK